MLNDFEIYNVHTESAEIESGPFSTQTLCQLQ